MSYKYKVSPKILELLPKAIEHNRLTIISNYQDASCCCLVPPSAEYRLTISETKQKIIEGVINVGTGTYKREYNTPDDIIEHIFDTVMDTESDHNLQPYSKPSTQDIDIAAAVITKVFRDKVFHSEYSYYLSSYLVNSLIYRYILAMTDQDALNTLPDIKDLTLSYGKFIVDFKNQTESYLSYISKLTFKGKEI